MFSAGEQPARGVSATWNNFHADFAGFTLHHDSDAKNSHDERGVVGECKENWLLKDYFIFDGTKTETGYRLTVKADAKLVGIYLWMTGDMIFDYNNVTGQWSFGKAQLATGREWKYCNPKAVMDIVAAALTCYASQAPQETKATISSLAGSLQTINPALLQDRYNAPDCQPSADDGKDQYRYAD